MADMKHALNIGADDCLAAAVERTNAQLDAAKAILKNRFNGESGVNLNTVIALAQVIATNQDTIQGK